MRKSIRGAALAVVGALLASLFLVLPAGSASAATYPPTTCSEIKPSTTTPRPGQSIVITGDHFKPNISVTLRMKPFGVNLVTVTTDASGSFSATVTMPLSARGHQTIDVVGKTYFPVCPVDPIQLVISSGGGSNGGGQPPAFTGVDVALLVAIGGVLLVAGALFTRSGRRRKHATH